MTTNVEIRMTNDEARRIRGPTGILHLPVLSVSTIATRTAVRVEKPASIIVHDASIPGASTAASPRSAFGFALSALQPFVILFDEEAALSEKYVVCKE